MSDAFDFFDFSMDEAVEVLEEIDSPDKRAKQICICGHAIGRHDDSGVGIITCAPAKQLCPCKKPRAVILAGDTRYFLRKTLGGGAMHALTQGMVAAVKAGIDVEWIVESKCDRCGDGGKVSPVPVSQRGFAQNEATGYDALLCADCRKEV